MERGEGHKNTAKIGSKLKSPPEAEELRSPLSVFSPNSDALHCALSVEREDIKEGQCMADRAK